MSEKLVLPFVEFMTGRNLLSNNFLILCPLKDCKILLSVKFSNTKLSTEAAELGGSIYKKECL